jgi:nucleoside-triphosphatase THEP1
MPEPSVVIMRTHSSSLALWTGPKHSGKTTAARGLIQRARSEGFAVAGIIAPSIYEKGTLCGFELRDLRDETRTAQVSRSFSAEGSGGFTFSPAAMELGRAALQPDYVSSADLIFVDEFGPLELRGQGWRREIDTLLACPPATALITLVTREEVIDPVRNLYRHLSFEVFGALDPGSADRLLDLLRARRNLGS